MLKTLNYRVDVVENGLEAVEAVPDIVYDADVDGLPHARNAWV